MSKRSLFYPKPLTGQGTEQVQSLLSYLEHLAISHNMKPRVLLQTLFREFPISHSTSGIKVTLQRGGIHGSANLGAELKKRLELATGESLHGATLERFNGIFAAANLARVGTAYCPCCVQEGDDLPYIRLLWQVQCVTACPVHNVKLRLDKTCGAPSTDRLPIQKRPALGGVCAECGSVGFRCIVDAPESASAEEVWVAEQVARLIGVTDAQAAAFSPENLCAGLSAVVRDAYGGSVVRAALQAGLSRSSVCTWIKGATPGLPWLLQLCFHAGADVVELLRGSFSELPNAWTVGRSYDVVSRPYTFAEIDDVQIRELILGAASEPTPPSVREFARRHRLHVDTPGHRFPEETRVLSGARRDYLARKRCEQHELTVEAYMQAARTIHASGRTVHFKSLQAESGVAAFSQNQPRVRALDAAITLFRHEVAQDGASA